MSRRKSVVNSPRLISLRRSPRFLSPKILQESSEEARIHGRKPGNDRLSGLGQIEKEESRVTRGEIKPDASKKSRDYLVGSADLVNTASLSRKSRRLSGSVDRSSTLRRSPRFSVGENSGIKEISRFYTRRQSPRFSSVENSSEGNVSLGGGKSSKLFLAKCKNHRVLSERGKGEVGVASSDRIPKRRPIVVAADEVKASILSSELKRVKNRKSIVCVNESQDHNVASSSGRNAEINGRRITRSMNVGSVGECSYKGNDSIRKNPEIVLGLCAGMRLKRDDSIARSFGPLVAKGEGNDNKRRNLIKGGEEDRSKKKRQLNHESDNGTVQGWTKEQEAALQRAYFTAKPSPRFWKKVSKLVPGKSAQECFDKVHSDQITPRQVRPRSRANKTNLSPIQYLSASKLLKPTEPKTKKPGLNKRGQLAQKTFRRLLEKQCLVAQGNEPDLFSLLEPSTGFNTLSTPNGKEGILRKFVENSSAGLKRPSSRFISSNSAMLVSPPVLKQVKDKALHEKYIDRLHCREAKRKAESAKVSGKNIVKPVDAQKKDLSRAATEALVFDVKDAIDKLKSLQADNSSSSSDFDCDRGESEDENEIDL